MKNPSKYKIYFYNKFIYNINTNIILFRINYFFKKIYNFVQIYYLRSKKRYNLSVGTNSTGVPTFIANKKLKRLKP
jgi:hypothetical protein